MTDYEYDEKFPYVVATALGTTLGRFPHRDLAECFAQPFNARVIDTTPKPRVPEDAEFITYVDKKAERHYAERIDADLWGSDLMNKRLLEELPGVTDETVFTVLDVRKQ